MSIDVGRGHPTARPGREPLEIDARRLLDATPECLVVAATDGRVVYANERVRDLSGFGPNELIDHPVDELVI
ncbi:MAG TPA: PAS domain-containing protein, partial [Actinomycetota bacterium]|nr:PAS domain-containing protein [Actinomycetota bacterium]